MTTLRPITYGACLLLMLQVTACRKWEQTTIPPQRLIQEENPSSVRVISSDGEATSLLRPFVRNDSVLTMLQSRCRMVDDGTRTVCDAESVGVPFSEIRYLEVRRMSTPRSLLLVGAVTVWVVAARWLFSQCYSVSC